MTQKEQIINFLSKNNHNYCDDCLAKILNISRRQTVNQICNKNLDIFTKERSLHCHNCNKIKITRSLKNQRSRLIK